MNLFVADIGATNARFALIQDNEVTSVEVLPCQDYTTLSDAANYYLENIKIKPEKAVFAIATPLDGTDRVRMTNHPWDFSIQETSHAIGLKALKIINDFEAVAHSIRFLKENDFYQLGEGVAVPGQPIGIIGPGSGLGMAGIAFDEHNKPVVIASEGGHVTMPAMTERELALFDYLKDKKYHHISAERVASGKGLLNIYTAIGGIDDVALLNRTPEEIANAGLDKSCAVSAEALDLFCHFLGVTAGNMALTFGAKGGVYIAGGIIPKLGDYFKTSRFYESFINKGRFKDYLSPIPVHVITHPYLALEGLRDIEV